MTDTRTGVREAFDRTAESYDADRRRLVPCFDDFYGTVLDLVPFAEDDAFDVVDLGAGTGLLSGLIRARFPHARLHLMDISEAMLARARDRFAGADGVSFRIGDLATAELPEGAPLVVSALSIHHLEDAAKEALYGRIFRALASGGRFLNADQVAGATPALERFYKREWERAARARGAGDETIRGAIDRMRHDLTAPLDRQLSWLREAGFAEVDCFYKSFMFAVFGGRKA